MAETMEKAHSSGSNKHGYDLDMDRYKSVDSCRGTLYRQSYRLLQNAI